MSGHPLLPQLKQRSKKEKKEEKEEHLLNEAEDDFIEDEVEENDDNKSWCQCFNRCMRLCPFTTIAGFIAGTIVTGREIVHRMSSQWNGQQQRELLAEAKKIIVTMPDGETLSVDLDPDATVGDLRNSVADTARKNRDSIRLSFGGEELDNSSTRLADAGLELPEFAWWKPDTIFTVTGLKIGHKTYDGTWTVFANNAEGRFIKVERFGANLDMPGNQMDFCYNGDGTVLIKMKLEGSATMRAEELQRYCRFKNGHRYESREMKLWHQWQCSMLPSEGTWCLIL